MKWIEIMKMIADNGMSIFTVSEFRIVTDLSETAAQKFVERYAKRGLLTRLKKGMYIVTDKPPTSFLISKLSQQAGYAD